MKKVTNSKDELFNLAPAMERYRALYKEYITANPEDLISGDLIIRIASAFAELAPMIGAEVLEELDQICEAKLAELQAESSIDM